MSFLTELSDAMGEIQTVQDSPVFVWKGAVVPCAFINLSNDTRLEIGGFDRQVIFALLVTKANFLTADSSLVFADSTVYTVDNDKPTPVNGRTVVFRGKVYRIASIHDFHAWDTQNKGLLRMDLIDANKR